MSVGVPAGDQVLPTIMATTWRSVEPGISGSTGDTLQAARARGNMQNARRTLTKTNGRLTTQNDDFGQARHYLGRVSVAIVLRQLSGKTKEKRK